MGRNGKRRGFLGGFFPVSACRGPARFGGEGEKEVFCLRRKGNRGCGRRMSQPNRRARIEPRQTGGNSRGPPAGNGGLDGESVLQRRSTGHQFSGPGPHDGLWGNSHSRWGGTHESLSHRIRSGGCPEGRFPRFFPSKGGGKGCSPSNGGLRGAGSRKVRANKGGPGSFRPVESPKSGEGDEGKGMV